MSKSFEGIETVKKIAKELSNETGISITISTVSLEPTSYGPGEFPINRLQWEEELFKLFDAYAPNRDRSWRDYGQNFENDTFWVHGDNHFPDCTCEYSLRRNAFTDYSDFFHLVHTKPCEFWWAKQAQFLHKPSGYEIHWYKYPCREAYGNQAKTIEEFRTIIQECISSLKVNQ